MQDCRFSVSSTAARLGAFLIVAIAWVGEAAAQAPPREEAKAPAANQPLRRERYWTTNWSFQDIDVATFSRHLALIGIDTGLDLRGTVTIQFKVGVPLTSLRNGAAYRFDGTLTSPNLSVDGVQFKDLQTSVVYRNGVATLENLHSLVIDKAFEDAAIVDASLEKNLGNRYGEINGQGSLELVPRGDLRAELQIEKLSVAPISRVFSKFSKRPAASLPQGGEVSGEVSFRVPLASVSNIEAYELEGKLSGNGLVLADLPPANFVVDRVTIADGELALESFSLSATSSDERQTTIRLLGRATVPLDGAGSFEFELAGDDVPVGAAVAIFLPTETGGESSLVNGKVDFRAVGQGRLNEKIDQSTWDLRASFASPRLIVLGVDLGTFEHDLLLTPAQLSVTPRRDLARLPETFKFKQFQSEYVISERTLTIDRIEAELFSGRLTGAARIPLVGTGVLETDIQFEGIRPSIILPIGLALRPNIAASFSGEIDWQVPMEAMDRPFQHQGTGVLTLSDITLGEEAIGQLKVQLSAQEGDISFKADGEVFGGTVQVNTIANMQAQDRWSDVVKRFGLTQIGFDRVSLRSLASVVTRERPELDGLVTGVVNVPSLDLKRTQSRVLPDADISLQLTRLSHRSQLLSRRIALQGKLERDVFFVDSLVGDYSGGTARVHGRIHLIDREQAFHPRADLRLAGSRIGLREGLWFLGDFAEDYQGKASGTATIAGHHEAVRIRGSVEGRELVVYDLPLGSAHSGLAVDADIGTRRWTLRFPSVRASVGGGQVEGELSLASSRRGGRGVDLVSRWQTRRVDFLRLTTQLGQSSSLAHGEITGDLSLSGKSIRTVDDLAGRFNFRLGETRGAGVPGLIGVSRFLGPVSLATQTFDVGEAIGVIGNGVLVIDNFWLGSESALVQADGRIFLRSKRMDLNALVATGDYSDIAANFARLAQEYALRSLLPASAILDITELLRDRTLVVRVMGTVQSPIVRLQPVETFREEAARFLLREGQRLILTGITAGAIDGLDVGTW